jgi:hypothetical protein
MTDPHIDSTFLRIQFDVLDGPQFDLTPQVPVELSVIFYSLPRMRIAAGPPQATPEKVVRIDLDSIVGAPIGRWRVTVSIVERAFSRGCDKLAD